LGNGKAYFFKGNEYVRFDITTDKADPGYPKPIDSNHGMDYPGLTVLMLLLIGATEKLTSLKEMNIYAGI
jgi:hypothetical protein